MNLDGYKFSLEAPLKVKEIEKNRLEKKLIQSLQYMEKVKARLKVLRGKERELSMRIKLSMTEGIEAGDLKELDQYLYFLDEKIVIEEDGYLDAQTKYHKLQGDMVRLLNEIDVLYELKKEKHREYTMELQKHEEKSLEDSIVYRIMNQGGTRYDQ